MIKLYPKGHEGFPVASIVYIPDSMVSTQSMPLFIYLHGKGEHGDGSRSSLINYLINEGHLPNWLSPKDKDGNIDMVYGEFKGLKIGSEYFKPDMIICMPLTAKDVVLEGDQMEKYLNFIEQYFKTSSIGIGGISFGGKGTLKARVRFPDRLKCFLPMAAAYQAKENLPFANGRMWSHHGAKDTVVWPNWAVYNSEYSVGYKDSLEGYITFNITGIDSLSELKNINRDIDVVWNPITEDWQSIKEGQSPGYDACSIYAGKGHGIQYHVLHQKRVWDWILIQLTKDGNISPPPEPEERPYKDMPDIDLIYLISGAIGDIDPIKEVQILNEYSFRVDKLIEKHNLKSSS